jgi:hypothetical protein
LGKERGLNKSVWNKWVHVDEKSTKQKISFLGEYE